MLIDRAGRRKYLVPEEWLAFLHAARRAEEKVRTFCLILAYTGARLSEVRALTSQSIDFANTAIIIECLKRRRRGIFRSVPVPMELIALLERAHGISLAKEDPHLCEQRLWPWCRTTAWTRVKEVGLTAGLPPALCTPRALRHSFGVEGVTYASVPIGTIKRWLGHARLESTIIYCDAVGAEERAMSARMLGRTSGPESLALLS
jgi:integrase/recombinase XerD